jgi:hypothetical protein
VYFVQFGCLTGCIAVTKKLSVSLDFFRAPLHVYIYIAYIKQILVQPNKYNAIATSIVIFIEDTHTDTHT